MKIGNLKQALTIAHLAQDHVHCVGKHGIAKTEIVKEWAKENGYHLEVLQLPILEVSDLVGMPTIEDTKNGKITTWAAPGWINRIHEANDRGQHAVIFLDELGRASFDVRQASLQLVLEGKINEHNLGELDNMKSLMVVADNPDDEYDTASFDPALEDRFQTYHVEADIKAWLEYAGKNDVEDVVMSYLSEFPEKLHFTPESEDDKGSTPRAWKKLSDGIKVIKQINNEKFVHPLIVSKVGRTVASNFFHYYNNYINVVKPEDIIDFVGAGTDGSKTEQEKMAKKLSKITKKIEVITAGEIGNRLMRRAIEVNTMLAKEVVVIFLASLNTEVGAGIAKGWTTSSDKEVEKFYLTDFQEAQGWSETDKKNKKWYLRKLISLSVTK